MRHSPRFLLLSVFFLLSVISFMLVLPAQPVYGATYTVTNLNNSGPGSLRQAIQDANATSADDTINFSVSGTINLTGGQLTIANTGGLTINGGGVITINRASSTAFRIFDISGSVANLTLSGVHLTNGSSTNGGAIYVLSGKLTMINSSISGSSATNGGAIANSLNGTVVLINTTLTNNSAVNYGGGLYTQGPNATIINSTITGNTTGLWGGGVYAVGNPLAISSTTISGNSAAWGGGGLYASSSATVTLENTIIANSAAGGDCGRTGAGTTITAYNTLIEDALTCVNGAGSVNNVTGDPQLGALTGSPAYFPLTASSALVIDTGDNSRIPAYIGTDQAGNERVYNTTVDRGATEYNSALPATTVTITPSTITVNEGANSDFTLTRAGSTASDLTVNLTITPANGDMTTSDYSLTVSSVPISPQTGSTTVTIPAGQASVNVNFAALDDVPAEPSNALTLALAAGSGYSPTGAGTATATIPANDYVVTVNDDSGEGTLRQAITNASGTYTDDTITFTTAGPIVLTSARLEHLTVSTSGSLTILGGGVEVTRGGATPFRIFNLAGNARIEDLTISNGDGQSAGGGAIGTNAALVLINCVITGNTASGSGGGILVSSGGSVTLINTTVSSNTSTGSSTGGGGLYVNSGAVTIINSTFSSNSATGAASLGGSIYIAASASSNALTMTGSTINGSSAVNGGGIYVLNGRTTITNSTITGATAASSGGGIYVANSTSTIINSTLSGNSAASGVNAYVTGSFTTLVLDNAILASAAAANCARPSGTVTAHNSVIQTDASCVNGAGSVNNVTTDPMLGALTGSPAYFPLTASSTNAINQGDNALVPANVTLDQAGNDRVSNGTVDRGSHEYAAAVPVAVMLTPLNLFANEGANADFTITRSGSTASDLTVDLTVAPTTSDMTLADYTLSVGSVPLSPQTGSTTVTIPAGQSSISLNFAALDDIDAEPSNALTVTVVSGAGYIADGSSSSGTAAIAANDFVVTSSADSGEGSLRQALANHTAYSSERHMITFTTPSVIVTGTELAISSGWLTIDGGSGVTVTRGSGTGRVINSNFTFLFMYNLTISGGSNAAGNGGGLYLSGYGAELTNVTISGNTAGSGGGIYTANSTYLLMSDSSITGNTATGTGGGNLYIASGTTASLNDTLISDGNATSGGGIYAAGTLIAANSFLFDNAATTGDAIYSVSGGGVTNSCIVGNGDTAVVNTTGTLAATGNWWGTEWGPNIPAAPAATGSVVSSGDSIGGTGEASSSVNVGIMTTPADYGDYVTAPVGDWLTSAPAGCGMCSAPSGLGAPRLCIDPRP